MTAAAESKGEMRAGSWQQGRDREYRDPPEVRATRTYPHRLERLLRRHDDDDELREPHVPQRL